MEKVKKFWKTVLKEREEFWGSLFQKYEDENSETDVSAYLDNTSQRINELLKLAALSDKETEDDDNPVVERYYEEQPAPNDSWEGFSEEFKRKSPIKPPEYVTEILPEDEVKSPSLSPVKKLKLFVPATPPKSQEKPKEQPISPNMDRSVEGNILNNSVRICKRSKPVVISKRFRLM